MRSIKCLVAASLVIGLFAATVDAKPTPARVNVPEFVRPTTTTYAGSSDMLIEGAVRPDPPDYMTTCVFDNNIGGITSGTLSAVDGTIYKFFADPAGTGAMGPVWPDPGCGMTPTYPFYLDTVTPIMADASLFGETCDGGECAGTLTLRLDIEAAASPGEYCSGPGAVLWTGTDVVLVLGGNDGWVTPVIPVGVCIDSGVYVGITHVSWTGDPALVPSVLWDSGLAREPGRQARNIGAGWEDYPTGGNGYFTVEVAGNTEDTCTPIAQGGVLNDECVNAIAVGDGGSAISNIGATSSGPADCPQAYGSDDIATDVWMEYTATCTGVATIDMCSTPDGAWDWGWGNDTKMGIYEECGGTQIGCNDDFCGYVSSMQIATTEGEDYYIRVGGYESTAGAGGVEGCGVLTIACQPILPGACCVKGVCIGDLMERDCEPQDGLFNQLATCGSTHRCVGGFNDEGDCDPANGDADCIDGSDDGVCEFFLPLAQCTQELCMWDNGLWLDDGGAPSVNEFVECPPPDFICDPAGDTNIIEAWDDFILEDNSATPNPCRLTSVKAWFDHRQLCGELLDPNTNWVGGVYVFITEDYLGPTGHIPLSSADGLGGCCDCVCEFVVPPGEFTGVDISDQLSCRHGFDPADPVELWEVDIPLNTVGNRGCTLEKNKRYWINVLPAFGFQSGNACGQAYMYLSRENHLAPLGRVFLGAPDCSGPFNLVGGNTGGETAYDCVGGDDEGAVCDPANGDADCEVTGAPGVCTEFACDNPPAATIRDVAFKLFGEKCLDCQPNGVCDDDDIFDGTSEDCDASGIPDECETDTDADGWIDPCDNCVNVPNGPDLGTCIAYDAVTGEATTGATCTSTAACTVDEVCDMAQANSDSDTSGDACDTCYDDSAKLLPGQCGCRNSDLDSDSDGTADCNDECDLDPNKTLKGCCGCAIAAGPACSDDNDDDGDGYPECDEGCDVQDVPMCPDTCFGVDDAQYPECPQDIIPTVSEWGLVIMALLLLVAGKVYFSRRTAKA